MPHDRPTRQMELLPSSHVYFVPFDFEGLEKAMRFLLVICLTIATLVTGVIIGNGLKALGNDPAPSSRVTMIYKNQAQPSIAELDDRAAKADQGEVNSDQQEVLQGRSQWI